MAFFRKWKTHYKHKKFTSDETNDKDGWEKGKSPIKEIQNIEDVKLYLSGVDDDDEDDGGNTIFETYEVKYLGCTPIEKKHLEKSTADAIKIVIANAKAGGRKSKTHKRVKLIVSQSGLEILDLKTQETLMRHSIYNVSHCSVDASNDHSFSFVASEQDPINDKEKLSCHVFDCAKHKIAHEITLMVARCFENAYQEWRETVMRKPTAKSIENTSSTERNVESKAEVHYTQPPKESLLIDLATVDTTDTRNCLQNKAWVNFEEDGRDSVHIMAC